MSRRTPRHATPHPARRTARRRGFSLVEMLIAISIAAVLSLAIAAALNASLMAYGASTESAGMQMSGRLVMQKCMAMIRTATLHDAYDPDDGTVTLLSPTDANHPLNTVGIQMITPDGNQIRIWWAVNAAYNDAFMGDLFFEDVTGGSGAQMLVRRVTVQDAGGGNPYLFTLASRTSEFGLLLSRATIDLQLERDDTQTTEMQEAGSSVGALRLVGSTVPRKNMD